MCVASVLICSADVMDPAPHARCHRIPPSWWLSGLAASTVLCAAVLVPMFDLRLYEPFVAVAVALLVAVLAVRALVCSPRYAHLTIWVSGRF